jgi:DNA transformation protein
MGVSSSFRTFVLEQLGRTIRDVRARSMFGGVGIYAGELFFALIADDTLYFKVDDSNRKDYEGSGMPPFRPYGDDGEAMHYYQIPEHVLEDAETLGTWAGNAIEVARRAKKRRAGSARRKTPQEDDR